MLEVKDLVKNFRKKSAVDHISFDLQSGIYGLLGPNGAGKTTLIRCLTNLYSFKGDISWQGESIKNNPRYMEIIGYLPQKFGAFRELTAEENLKYFCVLKRIDKKEWDIEIERVLQLVNLKAVKQKKAKALSGGMLRRLGIAQVLLGDPKIMIFDEPTAGLDPEERLRFKMLISSLSKDKIILISTHIVEDVDALCNQIMIMNTGQIVFAGSTKALKNVAKDKTFECEEDERSKLTGTYFIERQFEQDDKIRYRLVAESQQCCQMAEPKIEDGYICVLENI